MIYVVGILLESVLLVLLLVILLVVLPSRPTTASDAAVVEPYHTRCSFSQHDMAGLGDRLLDCIGYCVLCKRWGRSPIVVHWCAEQSASNRSMGRSSYAADLFEFPFETECDDDRAARKLLRTKYSNYSYNPFSVADMLGLPEVDEALVADYLEFATRIGPSKKLGVPDRTELADVVGVHLRKSDKIFDGPEGTCMHSTKAEFERILDRAKDHLRAGYPAGQRFFICSEDAAHKAEFARFLTSVPDKAYRIVEYPANASSPDVFDFFVLSRCKEIVQGVKYSTFSQTAAIIGRVPLINFFDYRTTKNFLNYWIPLIVNGDGLTIDVRRWMASPHKVDLDIEYGHTIEGDVATWTC